MRGTGYAWRRAGDAAAREAFSLARSGAFHLPRFALAPLAAMSVLLQAVFLPGRARAHCVNLTYILPEGNGSWPARATLTFKALRSYGLFVLEFLKISRMEREQFMRDQRFDGLAELDRALRMGRGVILAATHLGNWEAGARALACAGYKIHIVVGVQFSRSLSPYMKELKRAVGIEVVSPGPGQYRRLIEALRDNEIVVLAADGDTFEKGLKVPFFRGKTRAAAGPARLAALTGAPVLTAHALRVRPMRFTITFRTLWAGGRTNPEERSSGGDVAGGRRSPDRKPGGKGPRLSPRDAGFVPELTEYLMGSLEGPIAAHLDQWCIFRPLWSEMKG